MSEEILLGRQPIVDARGSLVAFELLFRSVERPAPEAARGGLDDLQASCQVIARSLADLGLTTSLGRFKSYVNADRSLLMSEVVEILPPERFVLEILETTAIDLPLRERIVELRARGYRIALDDVCDATDPRLDFLDLVDIVKIDLRSPGVPQWKALARRLGSKGKVLLAEKVETDDEFREAAAAGFDLFQGYFFARPQLLRSRRVPSSAPQMLRLITLLEQDPDIDAVAREMRRHPALAKPMLQQVNSSATGLRRQVDSIGTAIALVGLRQVRRWAQLLLYADGEGKGGPMHADPLVQQVGLRARLMELLAEHWHPEEPRLGEQAFLVGMLSKIDVLFGLPLPDLIGKLPLAPGVRDALLDRAGPLGHLLSVCEARERADLPALEALCRDMGDIDLAQTALLETQAAAWTMAQTDTQPEQDSPRQAVRAAA